MSVLKLNLPNAITVARIAVAPIICLLPFSRSPSLRLLAFVLFVLAAVTDVYDGWLARSRNMVTDLGRLLDPIADKVLLLATFVPMFVLMAPNNDPIVGLLGIGTPDERFAFRTLFGSVGLPWWVVAIVLGREFAMTVFRQVAARRGVVIAAIQAAKWKTGFQSTWIGASFFWIFAVTFNRMHAWSADSWNAVSVGVGMVGVVAMAVAVVLTVFTLGLYLARFRGVFR